MENLGKFGIKEPYFESRTNGHDLTWLCKQWEQNYKEVNSRAFILEI